MKKKADQYLEGQETEIFWAFDTANLHIQNTARRIYRWKERQGSPKDELV